MENKIDDKVDSLASLISNDLFTNGSGETAERLVLELPQKRDGGGWCKKAVYDVIVKHLTTKSK